MSWPFDIEVWDTNGFERNVIPFERGATPSVRFGLNMHCLVEGVVPFEWCKA